MTAPMIPVVSPNVSSQVVAQQAQPQTNELARFLLALRAQQDNEARTRIEQAQQQAQAEYQRQQVQVERDKMAQAQAVAAEALRKQAALSKGAKALLTPASHATTVAAAPSTEAAAPGLVAPISVPAYDPVLRGAVAAGDYAGAYADQNKEIIRQIQEQHAKQDAVTAAMANVPENLRSVVRTAITLQQSGLPAAVVESVYTTAQVTPDQLKALDARYPMFKELPVAEKLKQIATIKGYEAEQRNKLGPEYQRQQELMLATARLAIERDRLTLDKAKEGSDPKRRQAALDILRTVSDVVKNDISTFGQSMEERVQTLFSGPYLKAWQRARDYLIQQGLDLGDQAGVPPPVPTAPTGKNPLSPPPQQGGSVQLNPLLKR